MERTCCFTGHRISKLNVPKDNVQVLLNKCIDELIEQGYTCFICGMADGVDLWAGEIIIKKREENKNLILWCAIPYPKFKPCGVESKKVFECILEHSDRVEVICDNYFKGCFQKRNAWMVDMSSVVVAAFNGERGGTKNTIDYANRKNKRIINILDY